MEKTVDMDEVEVEVKDELQIGGCKNCEEREQLHRIYLEIHRFLYAKMRAENSGIYKDLNESLRTLRSLKHELTILVEQSKERRVSELEFVMLSTEVRSGESKYEELKKTWGTVEEKYFREPQGLQVTALKRKLSFLDETHPKCAGCELLFGAEHLARPASKFDRRDICQYCTRDISKYCAETFRKGLLRQMKETLAEKSNAY